jgi:hypothetical protein
MNLFAPLFLETRVNYNDEGNHFIIEYDGKISLVGGQEFLGIRKLTNHIQ